jgi:hypothetical protein
MGRPTIEDEKKRKGNGRGRPATPVSEVSKVHPVESGREAFNRIASYRVNGIIAKLNTLAKLSSGKARYGYKDEDVELVRKTLIEAVHKTCDRLRRKPSPEGFSFERKGEDATA